MMIIATCQTRHPARGAGRCLHCRSRKFYARHARRYSRQTPRPWPGPRAGRDAVADNMIPAQFGYSPDGLTQTTLSASPTGLVGSAG